MCVYTAVRVGRGLAALAHGAARALLTLLAAVPRPAGRAAGSFEAGAHPIRGSWRGTPCRCWAAGGAGTASCAPRWRGPLCCGSRSAGQVVGYVTDEQAFDAARADVQARLTGVVGPERRARVTPLSWPSTLDTRPMTERETADAILRAAGGEITEGTAVDLDGALRFVTDEGDHLRQVLRYAVRAPWQYPTVRRPTLFTPCGPVDGGSTLAAAITPQPRPDRRTAGGRPFAGQGRAVRDRDPASWRLQPQTIEDAGLDFGRTETVQAGQNGEPSLSPARSQPWRARSSAPA